MHIIGICCTRFTFLTYHYTSYANKLVKKFGLSPPPFFTLPTLAFFIIPSNSPLSTIFANSAHPPIHSPPINTFGKLVAPPLTSLDKATRVSDPAPSNKNHSLPNSIFVYSYPELSNMDNASDENGDRPYV